MRRRPRSSVRCDERTGSLFVIGGYTCTRELFGQNVPIAPAAGGGTDLVEHTIRINPKA